MMQEGEVHDEEKWLPEKKRRRRRRRRSRSPSRRHPGRGIPRPGGDPTHGRVCLTDEEWQTRNEKRVRVVNLTKSRLEYQRMSELWEHMIMQSRARPCTPDPNDRQVSKRQWEAMALHWRCSLRQYSLLSTEFDDAHCPKGRPLKTWGR